MAPALGLPQFTAPQAVHGAWCPNRPCARMSVPWRQRCGSMWGQATGPACRSQLPQQYRRQRHCVVQRSCSASGDADGVSLTADATASALIQKEVVLFLIQQDYDRQVQRSLNYENFEEAAELRRRREELDEAVEAFQESKGPGDGARDARKREAVDFASEGLRLRSELQRAVEHERYKDAAQLRDKLNVLQSQANAAKSAAAEEAGSGERTYRLGQRVVHSEIGYRGIICGWDVRCCEGEEWQQQSGVPGLGRGLRQPFYHVLVDLHDWDAGPPRTAITYVPEELLSEPEEDGGFFHPFVGLLFLGRDHQGDFLPTRQLRAKYSAQRRDVGPSDDDGTDDEESDSGSPDDSDGPSGGGGGRDFDGPGGGLTIL